MDFKDIQLKLLKNKKKIEIIKKEIVEILIQKNIFKVYFNSHLDIVGIKIKGIDKNLIIYTNDSKGSGEDFNLMLNEWKKILDRVKRELGIDKIKNF